MGQAIDQPLAGGASMGVNSFGTLGGILIGPVTGNNQYSLHAMSNWHVAGIVGTTKDSVCQPGKPHNGGTCQSLGTVEQACCDLTVQTASGTQMDVSATPISPSDRWNTICAQYSGITAANQGITPLPAPVLLKITAAGTGKDGDIVNKYGARTMSTSGTISSVKNSFNHDWSIKSTQMPTFVDSNPQSVPGVVPTGFTGTVPPQISPLIEPTYITGKVQKDIEAIIMGVIDPATGSKFAQDKATTIFNTLWANGRVTGAFCDQGDSGSWLVKDDGTVVGIVNRGGWGEREPNNFPILGHNWGTFESICLAYSINSALTYLNNLMVADSTVGFPVEVCIESARPVPPVSSANPALFDCTTATVSGTTCSWPYACKPNTSGTPACVPQNVTPPTTAAPSPVVPHSSAAPSTSSS